MTEFKQIIGRGTRINEDYGKFWFTIMDFKKATELFADPAFDGEPVMIYEPKCDQSPVPPDEDSITSHEDDTPLFEGMDGNESLFDSDSLLDDESTGRVKYFIGDVPVYVLAERVQYYGPDGKLVTESLKDYTRKTIKKDYQSLDQFLRRWTTADRKAIILKELEEHGILLEPLAEEVGKDFDAFDLICHVAFDQPPLTRRERVEQVKKRNYFTKYSEPARKVLDALLDKYADTGIEHIEDMRVLTVDPFRKLGTTNELVSAFGGKQHFIHAVRELKHLIYL